MSAANGAAFPFLDIGASLMSGARKNNNALASRKAVEPKLRVSRLLRVRSSLISRGFKMGGSAGGESVSQLSLKDKAFLIFLGKTHHLSYGRKLAFRLQSVRESIVAHPDTGIKDGAAVAARSSPLTGPARRENRLSNERCLTRRQLDFCRASSCRSFAFLRSLARRWRRRRPRGN